MSEMSNQNSENNGVNRTGPVGEGSLPGSCSLVQQQETRSSSYYCQNKVVWEREYDCYGMFL